MINFKKMDEKDFVFVKKLLNEEEEKAFSEFLRARKTKTRRAKTTSSKKQMSRQ